MSPTSWLKYPMVMPRSTATWPSSGWSSPVIIRKSVDLPDPLGPTRPTFSPFWSAAEASTKRIWWPFCLPMLSDESYAHGPWNTLRRPYAMWRALGGHHAQSNLGRGGNRAALECRHRGRAPPVPPGSARRAQLFIAPLRPAVQCASLIAPYGLRSASDGSPGVWRPRRRVPAITRSRAAASAGWPA